MLPRWHLKTKLAPTGHTDSLHRHTVTARTLRLFSGLSKHLGGALQDLEHLSSIKNQHTSNAFCTSSLLRPQQDTSCQQTPLQPSRFGQRASGLREQGRRGPGLENFWGIKTSRRRNLEAFRLDAGIHYSGGKVSSREEQSKEASPTVLFKVYFLLGQGSMHRSLCCTESPVPQPTKIHPTAETENS